MVASTPLLEAHEVEKSFSHVRALAGASLTVQAGEIVGLVGDNGAGKSTLVKALCGALPPDAGSLRIGGQPVQLGSPADARRAGIETIHQDLALAPDLDVAANLFLGREQLAGGTVGRRVGVLRSRAMQREAADRLDAIGLSLPRLDVPVGTLSGGQRQTIAIARAFGWPARVVLMDEPTAALSHRQTAHVLELIAAARERGTAIVLISHNLPELLAVVDRVVVMRLGRDVASFPPSEADTTALVALMTGLVSPDDAREREAA